MIEFDSKTIKIKEVLTLLTTLKDIISQNQEHIIPILIEKQTLKFLYELYEILDEKTNISRSQF